MKRFNVTGLCIPEKHYMCDVSAKFARCKNLIDKGKYFAINYPRQHGKTTMQYLLSEEYDKHEDCLLISTSFEGIGDNSFNSEEDLASTFLETMAKSFYLSNPELADYLEEESYKITNFKQLSRWLRKWIRSLNKKVILLIDEVDKASNNQVFVSFLAMLRDKYLDAGKNQDLTFHSVVLIGVHDVKALKLKLRSEDEKKINSPWNVAEDLDINFIFSAKEIEIMIADYAKENSFNMDIVAISAKLAYYTAGNPFLISFLCKIIDERLMRDEKVAWTVNDIELATKYICRESHTNTNFDDMVKNIYNNKELYQYVFQVIFENDKLAYNLKNHIIYLGKTYGVFKESPNKTGETVITSPIYEQVLKDWMMSLEETGLGKNFSRSRVIKNDCIDENGLNLDIVLEKFQEFMQEFHSDKDDTFLEKNARFILLSFLRPIVNGEGFLFKEPESKDNKRMDLVITFRNKRFIIELKIWRGSKRYDDGIDQLCNYLDSYSLDKGYMVVFNFNKNKKYKTEKISKNQKNISAVFV